MYLGLNEAIEVINEGRLLHIAGDESLLKRLPAGNWIGGTTPYFITNGGGAATKERVFINEIPDVVEFTIETYTPETVLSIAEKAYANGLTILVLPYSSEVAAVYSKKAPYIDELLVKPVVGWVSGYDLQAKGKAKVFDGRDASFYEDRAVALHIKLPDDRLANIKIVNIFEPEKNGDVIEFYSDAQEITRCCINGNDMLFAEYIVKNAINTKLPLIADYNGVNINVSVKNVNSMDSVVGLYAPVFKGIRYRFAQNVPDYEARFKAELKNETLAKPVFSCNCICNYLYGNLEGKKLPPFEGPVTFGEIAYQLLNQTLVYVEY